MSTLLFVALRGGSGTWPVQALGIWLYSASSGTRCQNWQNMGSLYPGYLKAAFALLDMPEAIVCTTSRVPEHKLRPWSAC